MFFAKSLIKGIIDVVSDIDPSQFRSSDPPPPRRPLNFAESHENDEEKKFRRVFQQLAGEDMEVSPTELMDILNKVLGKHGGLKTDGFSIESCRSMVAVMDSDSTGKLGFHEFKYMWNNIKKWQLYKLIIRRYSDEHGSMDFDNFIGCMVRLDAMCRAFKTLDKDNSGSIALDIKEWLQLTMYS
ncbi:Calpain small subunit 1 [Liparis tanakae]|uniref:Calpain small subunit 1 n=1 Tax=Liparis tanakae TaxID=230148 RepID=A0A4Z2G9D5_9TELE|nr:Calpain small subunit 1 [Liparis tanakae]